MASPHRVTIFNELRACKIYSLSTFPMFSAVLSAVVITFTLDLEACSPHITEIVSPLALSPHFPVPDSHCSTFCFYIFDFYKDFTQK